MTYDELKAAVLALPDAEKLNLIYHLQNDLGSWPLATLSAEDILTAMAERGYEHEKLNDWAWSAACRAASKYDSSDEWSDNVDWGCALVLEYAKEEGVELEPTEETEGPHQEISGSRLSHGPRPVRRHRGGITRGRDQDR